MQERKIIALLRERGRAGAARPAGTRWAAVRYVIVPILRDPQEREECLSEVTMRVWEKIDPFQEERGSWNGWLTSLTRHAALNHARRISRHGGAEAPSEDPPSPELTPEEVLLRQERQTALGTNLWGLNYLLPGIGLLLGATGRDRGLSWGHTGGGQRSGVRPGGRLLPKQRLQPAVHNRDRGEADGRACRLDDLPPLSLEHGPALPWDSRHTALAGIPVG